MTKHITAALAALAVLMAGALATPARAQTIDDIVAKYIEAKGGLEKWRSIESQRMTASAATSGVVLDMVIIGKRPNLVRQDITVEIPGQGPIAITNIYDGAKAWTLNPMMGGGAFQEMPAAEAKNLKDQADFDGPLLDREARGTTVKLAGTEMVGSRRAYLLDVTPKDGTAAQYYVDAETGAELKIVDPAAGQSVELSDHRPVDGVLVPHHIRIAQNGVVQVEIDVKTVEFNVPIEDSMFKTQ